MRRFWGPRVGPLQVHEVDRKMMQAHIDDMAHPTEWRGRIIDKTIRIEPWDGSTIQNSLKPLALVFGHAIVEGLISSSPLTHLRIPAPSGKRERVVTPAEAAALIAAIPDRFHRGAWGAALYAGLRVGEIRALRWCDVDLQRGTLRVSHSLDQLALSEKSLQPPKSHAGKRTIPIIRPFRELLEALDADQPGFVFSNRPGRAMTTEAIRRVALGAWVTAGLEPITPHEGRHSFASLMIASGANLKALSTVLGHASIAISLDRYGHLLPGAELEVGERLDAFLDA